MSMGDWFQQMVVRLLAAMFCCLPRSWHLAMGPRIGHLATVFARQRTRVTTRNLEWCFPNYSTAQRKKLLDAYHDSLGLAIFDNLVGWFWSTEAIMKHIPHRLLGFDAFREAQKKSDQGILLLGKHSQHMELDGRFIGMHFDTFPVQRGGGYSKFVNALIAYGRGKMASQIFPKSSSREFVKTLRAGQTLVYFPDQDYGPDHATKTTFLGVPSVLTTAPYRLHKLSNCLVYFYDSYYEDGVLVISIQQLHLPTTDADAFTHAMGRCIEEKVAMHPAEYLWGHKRFKSTKGAKAYA
jgi:KDO2-lipid IV(A) lauroyltransferase